MRWSRVNEISFVGLRLLSQPCATSQCGEIRDMQVSASSSLELEARDW